MQFDTPYIISIEDAQLRGQIRAALPRHTLAAPHELCQFRQQAIAAEYQPQHEDDITTALRRDNAILLCAKHDHFNAIHHLSKQYAFVPCLYDAATNPAEISLAIQLFINLTAKSQKARQTISDMEDKLFHVAMASTRFMERNEHMEELIYRDGMTHLHNHVFFKNALREKLEARDHTSSVVIIDLDYFKSVNDRFGHLKGDEVLQTFADCIREVIGEEDHITARYGGEEFAFLLNNTTSHEALQLLAQLRARFAAIPFQTHEQTTFHVNFSSGFVPLSKTFTSTNDVLKAADDALYTSKKNGRARDTCPIHYKMP